MRETFSGTRIDDDAVRKIIAATHKRSDVIVDPHTAVGLGAAAMLHHDPSVPIVCVATAHPAKFPDAVEEAIGERPQLPEHLADLLDREERCVRLPNDLQAVENGAQGRTCADAVGCHGVGVAGQAIRTDDGHRAHAPVVAGRHRAHWLACAGVWRRGHTKPACSFFHPPHARHSVYGPGFARPKSAIVRSRVSWLRREGRGSSSWKSWGMSGHLSVVDVAALRAPRRAVRARCATRPNSRRSIRTPARARGR
jgi:hypothetical protein